MRELEFINSKLTTQTSQLNPYFKIDILVDGSGSSLDFEDSIVEGPGEVLVSNGASFGAVSSIFVELSDHSN